MTGDSDAETPDAGQFLKNENAWKRVFDGCLVLDRVDRDGCCELSADELKEVGGREPRLMAKIESRESMPGPFRENRLCILPNKSRGNYIIGHFDAFQEVSYKGLPVAYVSPPRTFDTLDPYSITKEPSMILAAFNCGVLDSIADGQRLRMTDFGRESTPDFDFRIGNLCDPANPYEIHVGRSQLEMDGVFESEDCVVNIEAKMTQRSTFLSRQLYYPYRLLDTRTDKRILNVFLTYSANGSMYAHVYTVDEPGDYNSMRLLTATRYNFYKEIGLSEVSDVAESTRVADDSGSVFPQANSMERVFDALRIVSRNPGIGDSDLAYAMAVVGRQGGYYGNACEYLGLTERRWSGGGTVANYVTEAGRRILGSDPKSRNLEMIRLLCRHEVFNRFIRESVDSGSVPKEEITQWIRGHVPELGPDTKTPARRASTVKRWIDWVMEIAEPRRRRMPRKGYRWRRPEPSLGATFENPSGGLAGRRVPKGRRTA